MFEQLLQLVKEESMAPLQSSGVDPKQHENIFQEITHSILISLGRHLTGGKVGDVGSLLNGSVAPETSPINREAISAFENRMSDQGYMSREIARSFSTAVFPDILKNLVKKSNDPNPAGLDLPGILSHFVGGSERLWNGEAHLSDIEKK